MYGIPSWLHDAPRGTAQSTALSAVQLHVCIEAAGDLWCPER